VRKSLRYENTFAQSDAAGKSTVFVAKMVFRFHSTIRRVVPGDMEPAYTTMYTPGVRWLRSRVTGLPACSSTGCNIMLAINEKAKV